MTGMKNLSSPTNLFTIITLLLCLCLIPIPPTASAQSFQQQHTFYSMQDGLSNYWVNCLFQDSRGLIWIGTQDGLNRYDGYTFKQYLYDADNESGNLRNAIWAITEDEEGNLWIGTADGLDRRDRKSEAVTHFSYDPKNPKSINSNNISSLYLDNQGKLWIGTGGAGVNVLDTREVNRRLARGEDPDVEFKVLKHVKGNPQSLSSNSIGQMFQDRSGIFWICTSIGVDMFDPAKNIWRHFPAASALRAGTIFEDGAGDIWIAKQGLLHFDRATQQMHKELNQYVLVLLPDGAGRILLAGNDLLYRYSTTRDEAELAEFDRSAQAAQTVITACMRDRAGSLWIGTRKGILKRDDTPKWFSAIRAVPAEMKKEFWVSSISESDDGSLVLGTLERGLLRLGRNDTSIMIKNMDTHQSKLRRAENSIYHIRRQQNGRFVIGSGAGMYSLSGDLKDMQRLGYDANEPSIPRTVFTTLEDSKGNLWFAVSGKAPSRLLRYDVLSQQIDSTGILQRRLMQFGDGYFWVLLEDSQQRIWIGMSNGLACFNPKDSSFQHFRHSANDHGSLSNDKVRSILQDRRGNIFIGTWGGGLNRFNEGTKTFTHLSTRNGLADNTISGMLEDSRGNIWIATFCGLSKFNPETGIFTTYFNDVIQSIGVFHSHAFFKTRDGRFLFGGNGLLSFYPDSIRDTGPFPPIMVTSFSVLGKEVRREISRGDGISIPWVHNYFSLEFAALEFREPRKIQYAYMLEGVNSDWVFSGIQRFCSFTNLSPGTYVLRIKSTNSNGVWNGKPYYMTIRIVPPFYMTTWFKWLAGFIAFCCLFFLWDRRIKHVRKKEKAKRYTIEAELQALRLQMNPHFLFNSLNAIQNFLFESNEEEANKYLTKFARLMRMILENSRRRTIPVSEELEALNLYMELEALRFEFRFTYEIIVDPSVDTGRHMPSMLIQPYIENAIRHGLMHMEEQGHLLVALKQEGDALFCIVEDNGVGRKHAREIADRSRKRESIGMSVTEQRLNILNQLRKRPLAVKVIDLHDAAGNANGTRIEISIPVE